MTSRLARLRDWANILKQVLSQWQALLKRRRSGRSSSLAVSALAPEPKPDKDNASPASECAPDQLLHELSSAEDWQRRARAAERLTAAEADGVAAGLVRALSDRSVEVAVAAIVALSGRRESRVDSALLEVVRSTDGYYSPMTRARAIGVLAERLARSELAPIFDAVRDVDADVSVAAIAAIGEHAREAAGSILLPLLMDRSGYYLPLVRLAAAKALEAADALTPDVAGQLLEDEPDPAVQKLLEDARARMPSAGRDPSLPSRPEL
jgi:HEAT repeat protein